MTRRKRQFIFWGACTLLFASFGITAEDVWTEVKSPNFVVISNASPKQARKTIKSLEQFRLVIKSAIPALGIDPGTPLTVFAARDEKSFKALLAQENQPKGSFQIAGIFSGGPERKLVTLRIDLPGDQGYHVIYHEYAHMLVNLNLGEIPLWLNEGLAEFFGYATLSDEQSVLGSPGPQSLEILRTQPMVPLTTLFSVNHDSPYYHDKDKAPIFYAQSWGLTHYLMIGDKQAHAKQLSKYLVLLKKGVPDQEALAQALGDLDALEKALRNYVNSAAFYSYRSATKLSIEADLYDARTLDSVESLTARGELLVSVDKLDRAKEALEQCLQANPRSARANEAMGHLQMRLGDRKQAEKFYSAAADLDSDSYLAQFYSAQSKLQGGSYEDLSSAETQLRKAIAINPRFAPSYRQLSYALTRQSKFPEALDMAEKAVLLEPGVLSHSLNVANLMMAMGEMNEAHARAQQILARARTKGERNQAELLINRIQSIRNSRSPDRGTKATSQSPPLTDRQKLEEDQEAEEQLGVRDEMKKEAPRN